jgi:hypothetical protein
MPKEIDLKTVPDRTTPIAATVQIKSAATPRIKLSSGGFSVDHPDPEHGEQLMSDASSATSRSSPA